VSGDQRRQGVGAVTEVAPGVTKFFNEDDAYRQRLLELGGYVVNARRPRGGSDWVYRLHHKECTSIDPDKSENPTANAKWCGTREALTAWVRDQTGEAPTLCSACM
jgi:hypothetical protein